MNPTRRHLVAATLLGLAASQLPPFLAEAFGSPYPSPREPAGKEPGVDLTTALDRAHRAGRPLMVLVIPTDQELRSHHGQLLGALLNHGGDEALATLSLFHVVCAFDTELRRLGVPLPEEPWLAVLETEAPSAAEARFFAGAPPAQGTPSGDGDYWEQVEQAFEVRLDWIRRGLAGLAPDPATLHRWARQAEAVDPGRFASARAAALAGQPGPGMTALAPIAVAEVAAADCQRRAQLTEALATVARSALLPERVAGSHWAQGGGCGLEIEGSEVQNLMDCGMGQVPTKARRMLYFWSPERGG